MDFVIKKLNQEIEIKKILSNDKHDLGQYSRVKIEYYLLLILGYLWNKNFKNLKDEETRQYIISKIIRPSLGTIIEICQKLDFEKEIFSDRKLVPNFFEYTSLRNELLGHGYLFSDKIDEYIIELEKFISIIEHSKIELINKNFDFIHVLSNDANNFKGISYKSVNSEINPWLINKAVFEFEINATYITYDYNTYYKISPFVHVFKDNEFYLFRCVEEKLNGRVDLNNAIKTKNIKATWEDFVSFWEVSDGTKRISGNGTIINVFNNNYANYIKIGTTKRQIEKFLDNRSSVAATIWGHGGVGKTATIQSVCQDLLVSEQKKFDYVLFLTAKDRFYNYHKGEIEEIDDRIDNYENLIELMNNIVFDERKFDEDAIINLQSRILLIIDDFETFSPDDQKKIGAFIDRLDINFHKVIITTRISNLKIGGEIETDELNEAETRTFVAELLKNQYSNANTERKEKELNAPENYKSIFFITSGRPLFIYQFVAHWMKTGLISDAISKDIKSQQSAIDFLYGRIYRSLDKTAKDIFDAISLLVNETDLSNLVEKLKYILNKEKDEEYEAFDNGLNQLNELLIIKVENGFFTVNSKEILEIMSNSLKKRGEVFIRFVKDRLNQVGRNKELDTDVALLKTADSYRTSRNETEVESIYRQILNRSTNKKDIQLRALLNLSDYWFNYRGTKEKAITILEEYEVRFSNEPVFIKMLSNYCWAKGLKHKANRVLTIYFETKPNYAVEINLELLGLLVIYKSITIIEEREELKSKRNFGQILENEYLAEYNKQKQAFGDIFNFYGHKLFELSKKSDITTLKPGTRQNIATGLYQLIDVCCRINRGSEALQICNYGLQNLPENFHKQFNSASNRVKRFMKRRY